MKFRFRRQEAPAPREINEKTRMPLGVVAILVIFIAQAEAVVLFAWKDMSAKVQRIADTAITEKQFQTWRDDAVDMNKNVPVTWPRVPERKADTEADQTMAFSHVP